MKIEQLVEFGAMGGNMSKALNSVPQDDPVCQTNLLSIVPILSHYHTPSCGLCCFLRVTHLVVRFQRVQHATPCHSIAYSVFAGD